MDYFFPFSGERHASPIWISDIMPLHSGNSKLAIKFWQAISTADEHGKDFTLRVIRRTEGYLVAERMAGTEPPLVILTAITTEWIKQNFPHLEPQPGCDVQNWCDKHIGRSTS
jgi:hypothetical protein